MLFRLFIFMTVYGALLLGCSNKGQIDKDKLVNEICKDLETRNLNEDDSVKWVRIFQSQLEPRMNELKEDSALALYDYVTIRLQRECVAFRPIARYFNTKTGNSDWQDVHSEPESKISQEDYQLFFRIGTFKYLATNGDTAFVILTDSTWEDKFPDSTYSKLSLEKLRTTEFVITFIESNHKVLKNYSKPGDMYRYKILERHEHYFAMFVQPVRSKVKSLFKLYY